MHPLLFEAGPIHVYSWAVLVVAGLLAAYWIVPRYGAAQGFSARASRDLCVFVILWGIVGAKVLHVVTRPESLRNPRELLAILLTGGVVYGGLLAGMAAAWFFLRRHGGTYAQAFDIAPVPVLVGQTIERIGCLLSGCCFGSPSDLPWAVRFTDPLAHRLHRDLPDVPLHPVQLYEAAGTAVLALALDRLAMRPHRTGAVGFAWCLGYGVLRTAVEFLRGDAVRGGIGPLSTSQIIGIGMIVAGAIGLLVLRRREGRGDVPAPAPTRRGATAR